MSRYWSFAFCFLAHIKIRRLYKEHTRRIILYTIYICFQRDSRRRQFRKPAFLVSYFSSFFFSLVILQTWSGEISEPEYLRHRVASAGYPNPHIGPPQPS